MAAKLGKREKIVAGCIVGIAAILAVHMLVYQNRANQYTQLKQERDAAMQEAQGLPPIHPNEQQSIEAFKAQTAIDEKLLWETTLNMDLLVHPVFFHSEKEPPKPEKPDPKYEESLKAYKSRTDPIQVAFEAMLIERFERLIDIKKAYESGVKWKGDAPKHGDPGTNIMKLTFMGEGPINPETGLPANGWNLPVDTSKITASGANLWDQVSKLHDRYALLSMMQPDSIDYAQAENDYILLLQEMGLDKDLFPVIKEEVNEYLPEFIKLLHARLIWKQRKEGEVVRVGLTQELSLDLLKRMYDVYIPRAADPETGQDFQNLNRQLQALERLLPIARRNKIEEVEVIRLPKPHWIGGCEDAAIIAAKAPPAVESTPTPRSLLLSSSASSNNNNPMNAMMRRGNTEKASPSSSVPSIAWAGPIGMGSLIDMDIIGTNESVFRFLYDALADPLGFRITSLGISALENQKVKAHVIFDVPVLIAGVSKNGELVDINGKPLNANKVGEQLIAEWKAKTANDPLAIEPIIQKAFTDAGYTSNVLETLGTPAPDATPPPKAPPAAPRPPAPSQDEEGGAAAKSTLPGE